MAKGNSTCQGTFAVYQEEITRNGNLYLTNLNDLSNML